MNAKASTMPAESPAKRTMVAVVTCAMAIALAIATIAVALLPVNQAEAASTTQTTVKVGAKSYTMKLASNKAAAAFRTYLSKTRTLKMKELNANEKYRYLSKSFPANPKRYKKVRAGDVMLYGDDCLVIFYKTHKTSYRYTKIGKLTSTKGLAKAVGKKSVKVRFSKMKQVKKPAKSTSAPATPVTEPDANDASEPPADTASPSAPSEASGLANGSSLTMTVNGEAIEVEWENNDSVTALAKMAQSAPVEIRMSGYGGFEQVGGIGASLPRNDVQITTSPGDIVLYAGNQMVLFHGSNTWSYTKLGKIVGKTDAELKALLGGEDVVVKVAKKD